MAESPIILYHNARCQKSRAGLEFLQKRNISFILREYSKEPFTVKEMEDILIKLNRKPAELIRTKEKEYIVRFRGRNFTDAEWIRILIENPKLIRRPIVAGRLKAVIGEDIKEIEKLIGTI